MDADPENGGNAPRKILDYCVQRDLSEALTLGCKD